ncbi:hemerythrin domain-containing protein [Aequorivita sp. F47161]|uniref:Hemerythrin domain-containing protein n=1 Tax=Aequorivita vitellina TaxID=2874475 RepID=A0A9X1U3Q8_9FLAO|nr:hemerythrin domain-containing protein [Aequorivita vitellina]MCG2419507.1 hemerythrin domain-containing protein [Aequorivita vitellina]MCZ4317426.1 hemerythrin domain-containing protein [Aequorivita viscosa]
MKKHTQKKNLALTPIIEEHNEVILLCERIREGLRNKVENKRIKKYIDWFKANYLDAHFEIEEKQIFPILGSNNVRVKRALANHRRLNRLFEETAELHKVLHKIEEELSSYIHFEERILYREIQAVASEFQLQEIENIDSEIAFTDDAWKDRFWVSSLN